MTKQEHLLFAVDPAWADALHLPGLIFHHLCEGGTVVSSISQMMRRDRTGSDLPKVAGLGRGTGGVECRELGSRGWG